MTFGMLTDHGSGALALLAASLVGPAAATATSTPTSATTGFAWDQSGSLPLLLQAGATYCMDGPDGHPIEQIDGSGTASFYLYDQTDNVWGVVNAAGSVTNSYAYDPYGNQTAVTGSTSATPFGFAGLIRSERTDDSPSHRFDSGRRPLAASLVCYTRLDKRFVACRGVPWPVRTRLKLGKSGARPAQSRYCNWLPREPEVRKPAPLVMPSAFGGKEQVAMVQNP